MLAIDLGLALGGFRVASGLFGVTLRLLLREPLLAFLFRARHSFLLLLVGSFLLRQALFLRPVHSIEPLFLFAIFPLLLLGELRVSFVLFSLDAQVHLRTGPLLTLRPLQCLLLVLREF